MVKLSLVSSPALIRSLELILVVGLAWQTAGLITQQPPQFAAEHQRPSSADQRRHASLDVDVLTKTPLFGEVKVRQPKVPEVQPETKPVVTAPPLDISLLGTAVAGDNSLAILRTANDNKERIVRLHTEIASGVLLEQVFQDAIEVRDHGRVRRIALRQENNAASGAPASPARPVNPPSAMPPPPAGAVQRHISRNTIRRATRNFSQLLTQARVVPHFVQGKADGFVISNIVPRSLFQTIGLRNGDIIRKVNQEPITSAAQAMKLYQSLQHASNIQLEVERAGQMQTINYHIQ